MQQTRPRLESSHVNTECVRKEEEEEEEEKEEERKEEGRSWRCARKTRTPHKGCGEIKFAPAQTSSRRHIIVTTGVC